MLGDPRAVGSNDKSDNPRRTRAAGSLRTHGRDLMGLHLINAASGKT
jgi:hypothetical protein